MISRPELRWSNFWWACDWAIVIAVVLGSLIPPNDFPKPVAFFNDKVLHFGAYFLMAFWFAGSLERKRYVWVAVGLAILGALIEVVQYWMGFGRDADWRDFVADVFGIAAGLGIAWLGLGNWMAWVERRFVRAWRAWPRP
jgi:VanZ family protein